MSDDTTFGDYELDDAWADEPADPEQVAMWVHDLRQFLSESAGDELAAWDALSDADREVGTALATRLINALVTDADHAPQDLHAAIAYLSDQPEWDALSAEAQEVGVGLVDNVMAWLTRQGSVRTA